MILDVFIFKENNLYNLNSDMDIFEYIKELNDISEDLIVESMELDCNMKNISTKLIIENMLLEYTYLKEDNEENKKESFFKKLIKIFKSWFNTVKNIIIKFFNKLRGLNSKVSKDKDEDSKELTYQTSEDIEGFKFESNFEVFLGILGKTYTFFLISDLLGPVGRYHEENRTITQSILKYFEEHLTKSIPQIIEELTGEPNKKLIPSEIVNYYKERNSVIYKADGSNVPELHRLKVDLEMLDNIEKDYLKEFKDFEKKAETDFSFYKTIKYDHDIQDKFLSLLNSAFTTCNSFNNAYNTAALTLIKDMSVLLLKLINNYK